MLEAQGLACIRGRRSLFTGLDLAVAPGQLLRITGENGSGKTSLLRILCGLLAPAAGEVTWNGVPVARDREEFHRALTYIGHAAGLKDELTPVENLAFAATLAGQPVQSGAIRNALQRFGVLHCAGLPVRSLSQGQRRRVALARLILAGAASLWILDEPFTALDSAAVDHLEGLITTHVTQGGMVVLTTHLEVAFTAGVIVVDLGSRTTRA